jgi:hypothetical protein
MHIPILNVNRNKLLLSLLLLLHIFFQNYWMKLRSLSFRYVLQFTLNIIQHVGRDSVVGIAIRYELDGPGIESRRGRDFQQPSRPALGPTQPPVQWVAGHSRG